MATIEVRLAAIRHAHRLAGAHLDLSHPAVRAVWRGIRRLKGRAQVQAQPVLTADLMAMLAHVPDSVAGYRDRALVLVGFAGAFRRSELVALDVADVTLSADAMLLAVRRSKTDQEGRGRAVKIARGKHDRTCPVRALTSWLEAANIVDGPIFRRVARGGKVLGRLTDQSVTGIVKRLAAAARIEPTTISGHSLRRGHVTQAKRAGVDDRVVMAQGGWRSRAAFDRYDDVASAESSSASLGL